MLSLSTIMINSEDTERLGVFYRQLLGDPGFEGGPYTGWKAGSGYVMVGPHSDVVGQSNEPARLIINFETSDVQGEFERIKALGAKVEAEPYQPQEGGDMWLATFSDPDGNLFQLASPSGM